MIIKSLNEAKTIDLGSNSVAYQYKGKYYIRSGDTKKEISSDQYNKLIDKASGSNSYDDPYHSYSGRASRRSNNYLNSWKNELKNINMDDWNDLSTSQREDKLYNSMKNFIKDNGINKNNADDFIDELESENYHTEAELVSDIVNNQRGSSYSTRKYTNNSFVPINYSRKITR